MKRFTTTPESSKLAVAAACLLFYLYIFLVADLKPVESMRLKGIDSLYRHRYQSLKKAPPHYSAGLRPPVVIAAIDDESLRVLGERWPWRRRVLAEFLDRVSELGASAVGFDLSFSIPSEDPEDDLLFKQAIDRNGKTVLGFYFGTNEESVMPLEGFESAAAAVGFLNVPRDSDNTNRRHWAFRRDGDRWVYSFGARLTANRLAADPEGLARGHYGDAAVEKAMRESADAEHEPEFWSVYDYGPDDVRVIPVWKFLQSKVKREDVEGRVVLVGATGEIFHDVYQTPLGPMPGVLLHANLVAAYFDRVRVEMPPPRVYHTALLALVIGLALVFCRLREVASLLLAAALAAGIYWTGAALLARGILIDLFAAFAALGSALAAGLLHRSAKLFVENQGLRRQSFRDGLTDLYTYRYMERTLMSEFDRSKKAGETVSFVIFDLDHFKRLNDVYGHEKGNEILVAFARILKSYIRGDDLVARYGGEEFCLLLPRRNREEAFLIAERIRMSLAEMRFKFTRKGDPSPSDIGVTVSAGICSSDQKDAYNGKELLRLADAALLAAKEKGRNQVCVYS